MGCKSDTQNKIVRKKEGREYFRPSVMLAYAVNPGQIPGMHFPSKTDIVPAWIRK